MKKILSVMTILVLFLAGCSSDTATKELVVWNTGIIYEDPNEELAPEEMPLNQEIEKFEKDNPDYKVTLVNYDADSFNQAFTAANQAGKGPDVIITWAGTSTLDFAGYLEDLTPYLSDGDKEVYDTSALTHIDFDPENPMVGIPNGNTTTGLFYNKTIFDDNGIKAKDITTWDDVLTVSQTLLDNGVTPVCVGDVDGYTTTWAIGEFLIDQVGPEGLADLYAGTLSMDDESFINSVNAWKELFDGGYTNPDWASTNDGDALTDFTSGTCGMMVQGSWALHGFNDLGEDYDVIKFPSLNEDAPYADYVMSQPMVNVAVTNYSENKDAAVDFAKAISTPEFVEANDQILYADDYTAGISTEMNSWAVDSAMGFDSAINGEAASEFYKLAPTAIRGDITVEDFLAQVQALATK